MNNKVVGKIGENIAAEFLENKGYKILERNFQNKWGEIDLICRLKNQIVFVEVKTRIGERLGQPEDAVNKNKIQKLINNATAYMNYKMEGKYDFYRIDAICIVLDEQHTLKRIDQYENILL